MEHREPPPPPRVSPIELILTARMLKAHRRRLFLYLRWLLEDRAYDTKP